MCKRTKSVHIVSEWICDRIPTPYRVSMGENYIRIQMQEDCESVKVVLERNVFVLKDEDGYTIEVSTFIEPIIKILKEKVDVVKKTQ